MEFEIEKYAMLIIVTVKQHITEVIEQQNQDKIKRLGERKTYKYLSILEVDAIKQVAMKEKNRIVSQRKKLLETKQLKI